MNKRDTAPSRAPRAIRGEGATDQGQAVSSLMVRRLQAHLLTVREDMRRIGARLDDATREFVAADEASQAMTEELRVANEELGSSKQELQRLNETLLYAQNEQQRHVQGLLQTRDDLLALIVGAGVTAVVLDRELRLRSLTPAAAERLGLGEGDLGRPARELGSILGDAEALADAGAVLERLAPVEREVMDGQGQSHWRRMAPHRSPDDHIDGVVVAFQQITRPHADERSRDASSEQRPSTAAQGSAAVEARLASLVRSTRAAVVTWTSEGRIIDWNDGAARLFGYTADEIVGRPIDVLAMAGERRELSGDGAAANGIYDRELEMRHKDGRPVHVAWTAAAVCDAEGRVIGAAGVGADVGDRVRLERQVAQMADRQRQALGRELHDSLGQQLTAIGLLASALRARAEGDKALRGISEKIEHGIETAKSQLRAIVKGLAPVEIDARGLAIALEELADETRHTFGIDCRFELVQPAATEDQFTANQLYLIAREAVHNAVKHASPHSIVIRLEATDGLPKLSVIDDGVGIARTDEDRGSTSMGLRIMRYRCRVIGGDLRIAHGEAGGTIVTCGCRRPPAQPPEPDGSPA